MVVEVTCPRLEKEPSFTVIVFANDKHNFHDFMLVVTMNFGFFFQACVTGWCLF